MSLVQPIQLLHLTGCQQIDDILHGLIGVFESTFPDRIRSYYLVGSYASGTASSPSDIDLRVIFKGQFIVGEEERMLQVRQFCRLISPIRLDCPPLCEHCLLHDEDWLHEPLSIKSGGLLLYGDDIQDQWPPPGFAAYVRNVTEVPVRRFSYLRDGLWPLIFPLTYPDPGGEFYGYDRLDDYIGEPSLKGWVHAVGFVATCIVALKGGQIVARKEDWLPMYRQYVGNQWTNLLAAIYHTVIKQWSYRIPTSDDDRSLLRDLCRRTLAFENDYLLLYRTYLLDQSRLNEPARNLFAAQRLQEVVYPDEKVLSALRTQLDGSR